MRSKIVLAVANHPQAGKRSARFGYGNAARSAICGAADSLRLKYGALPANMELVAMLDWNVHRDALTAPAVARNRDAILGVLRRVLPARGTVLEIASGSGEHAIHIAAALPGLTWLPSDPEPEARRSIVAHTGLAAITNILPPLALDARDIAWPVGRVDAIVCINMIHIAPWSATEGLMSGAGRALTEGGILFLYGPFREGGRHTAESNIAFDASLRARDPEWGVRDREAVIDTAARHGLVASERVAMPANNLSLIFRRAER